MKSIFLFNFKLGNLGVLLLFIFLMASCSSDDSVDQPVVVIQPIELDCDYFLENRTLVDNPNAPIDYIISCNAQVRADLVIEPGVVIAFTQDAGLNFYENESSIRAVGTANLPIILTGTNNVRGFWRGLFIDSTDPSNILDHVTISYAGGQAFNSNGDRGNVIVYADASLTMTNCLITHSATSGLNARYGGSNLTLENNSFTNNANPLLINYIYVGTTSATNNFIGNDLDRVLLYMYSSAFEENTTWKRINVPYRTFNGGVSQIKANANLIIEPGTIIEMTAGSYINVTENGGLKAVGTSASPIIIRGETAAAGAWKGIKFDGTNVINEIAYAQISDAGEDPTNTKGAVYLWYEAKLNIHDVQFNDLLVCGVYGRLLGGASSNPNFTSSNLTFANTLCDVLFD